MSKIQKIQHKSVFNIVPVCGYRNRKMQKTFRFGLVF